MYIRLFRDATNTGGGGIKPSLADLEAGNGVPEPPDLSAAAQQQQQSNNEPPKDGTTNQPQSTEQPGAENKNSDATKGEEKGDGGDGGKDKDVKDPKDGDGGEEGNEEDYYAVVDKITGRSYEIEYPEGVDPVTPEGTAFRENFIRETAFQEFEEYLKTTNPRGFAYLLHLQNGGNDEQFFKDPAKGFVLPSLEQLKESVDVQKAVYSQDLLNKGVDKETVDAIVEKAIKDNKLLEKSTASHNFISANQKKFLEDQEKAIADAHARTTAAVQAITTKFTKAAEDMSFIVPENKRSDFTNFIINNLQMTDDGKFMFVQEVNPDDLKGLTEALFFQYTKGDLSQFVQKKVKTEAAHRLKVQASKTQTNTNRDAGIEGSGKKTLTLGEL